MANTYVLGGSPLGLINTKSRPERTGMSTYNAGKSRNMNVFYYNRGVKQQANAEKAGKQVYAPVSQLSGGSLPTFWPNADIGKIGSESGDQLGIASSLNPRKSAPGVGINSNLHNDSAYDTSILNIIERLSKSNSAALRPQDFAYCKFLGVYPNNRLMVARRFPAPIGDNIFSKSGTPPKSILISWRPDNEDFLEFTFGEEWTDADADFTNVLNKLGKDFGIDAQGGGLSKAINLIPLPSFTEQLQRGILEKMGVLKEGSEGEPLPSGNPNIIKMAKRRKTIGYGEAGAGLKASFSIKMSCEYEQKFISGIDPTVAWQDILNNIMIFGTSNSSNYGLSKDFESNIKQWTDNPGTLVVQIIESVRVAVDKIKLTIADEANKALTSLNDSVAPSEDKSSEENSSMIEDAKKQLTDFFDKITKSAFSTISKYKIEIMGIANALSGSPSTPWHITIGNPLRPFFCSGDMLISGDVKVNFGAQLAFNDLPSSIKVEFTLVNSRPLGMQEILAKFNSGNLRTVNVKRDYIESDAKANNDEDWKKALESKSSDYFDATFDFEGEPLQGPVGDNIGLTSSGLSPSTIPGVQQGDILNIVVTPLGTGSNNVTVFVASTVSNADGSIGTFITATTSTLKDSNPDDVVNLEGAVPAINLNNGDNNSGFWSL